MAGHSLHFVCLHRVTVGAVADRPGRWCGYEGGGKVCEEPPGRSEETKRTWTQMITHTFTSIHPPSQAFQSN